MAAVKSSMRFATFPRTEPPADFSRSIVDVFRKHEDEISTTSLGKGLTSDHVLEVIASDLIDLGFEVEVGKAKNQKIDRPVFFGENGIPTLRYQIDGYHPKWKCAVQVEAGRAWMGNAVYKDLLQASVMVEVEHLCLAVPNNYKYQSGGKSITSRDYENTNALAEALFGHTRLRLPYKLLLIGY